MKWLLSVAGLAGLSSFVLAGATSTSSSKGALHVQKRDDNLPARLPYVFPPPGTNKIADTIRQRRTNETLLDLDGLLLNAPLLADAWNTFFGVVRDNNTLPPDLRELIITRVGAITNSAYVWLQHESVARSVGISVKQLLEIRHTPAQFGHNSTTLLNPAQAAMMAYTDWMTNAIKVPQAIFNDIGYFLNDKQMVEATATIGGYNLVSRFVVALNADDKMDVPVPEPV